MSRVDGVVNPSSPGVASRHHSATWVALPLALLGVLWLYRRLVAGWVLAGGDLHTYFFPYWAAAARAFRAGELPLWNPYLFAGAPLLANSQVGVFYPLNWPLWLLAGSSLNGVTRALHASVLLHLALAASTAYVLARRLGVQPWSAALSGFVYAGSGFLGIHVEHLNQLHALAWLPLVFLPVDGRRQTVDGGKGAGSIEREESGGAAVGGQHSAFSIRHPAFSFQIAKSKIQNLAPPLSVFALAMILLAGHTQMAFIAVVGLVVNQLSVVSCQLSVSRESLSVGRGWRSVWRRIGGLRAANGEGRTGSGESGGRNLGSTVQKQAIRFKLLVSRLTFYVLRFILSLLPFSIAGLIAAVQLLPTVELSRWSVRSGGLPWREAVSFSLRPWDAPRALLPPYLLPPLLPEGVAYLGLVALVLAGWGAWRAVQRRNGSSLGLIITGGMGLFLSLGAYNPIYLALVRLGVPGFVHFRAPVRFLGLSVLAASLLAGMGLSSLPRLRGRWRSLATAGIAALVFAELWLAAERMPHAAATDPRAYTDLRPATAHLVAQKELAAGQGQPPDRFLSISQTLFDAGDEADIDAVYGVTLSADALWAYKVAAKQREVLAPNLPLAFGVPAVDGYDGGLLPLRHYVEFSRVLLPEGTLDGRLRENLHSVPDARWLSLMGARFVITDKTGDAWADDVFYDRQFRPALAAGESMSIAWLPDDFAADAVGLLYAGTGNVRVALADGRDLVLPLPASETTGGVYRARWDGATRVAGVSVRAAGGLSLAGASLIDERTGAFYPLVLSEHFRLAHSGDVKIYENLDVLPRAFLVHDVKCAPSDDAALALMQEAAFDPGLQVVLSGCDDDSATRPFQEGTAVAAATVVAYEAARVTVEVNVPSPGVLVLAEAWYPGWRAVVASMDGHAPAFTSEVLRADVLFRGVPLPPGAWRVTFEYHSVPVTWGAWVSLAGLVTFLGYAIFYRRKLFTRKIA